MKNTSTILKIGRTAIAAMATLSLAFALVGCGGSGANDAEKVIKESIETEFNSYKTADDMAMSRVASTAEKEGLTELGISGEEFATAVLNGFDYKITDIKIDGSNATATVVLVSKSMSDFEAKLQEAVQGFVSGDQAATMSAEEKSAEIGKLAMQAFEQTKVIDEEVQLQFTLTDNTWTSTGVSDVLAATDSLVFAS